jgi:TolA-binding protein
LATLVAAAVGLSACSVDSTKSRYVLAEKLWADGKYAAAVSEFEKVTARDPKGKLGLQALFRAAMTQSLYLNQQGNAVKKFRTYIDAVGDTPASWEAQKQIGEILFTKTEQYEQAILHYRNILKLKPNVPEAAEFHFRIAKSLFFLWQFDEAVAAYEKLQKDFPHSPWAEKAAYEIGVSYFTRGEQQPGAKGQATGAYQSAIKAFEQFVKAHPSSKLVPEAKFGIASSLEELDQLDAAYAQYEALLSTYPSPNVIRIKLARIKQRKLQRSR